MKITVSFNLHSLTYPPSYHPHKLKSVQYKKDAKSNRKARERREKKEEKKKEKEREKLEKKKEKEIKKEVKKKGKAERELIKQQMQQEWEEMQRKATTHSGGTRDNEETSTSPPKQEPAVKWGDTKSLEVRIDRKPPSDNPRAATDEPLDQDALKAKLNALLQLPENKRCADCGVNAARWASTNLGVFICIDCSGIHRGMGTHISKVKSCTLDTWTPEQVHFMEKMGNAKAKAIWEARLPAEFERPDHSDKTKLTKWIKDKYEYCKYKDAKKQKAGSYISSREGKAAASSSFPSVQVEGLLDPAQTSPSGVTRLKKTHSRSKSHGGQAFFEDPSKPIRKATEETFSSFAMPFAQQQHSSSPHGHSHTVSQPAYLHNVHLHPQPQQSPVQQPQLMLQPERSSSPFATTPPFNIFPSQSPLTTPAPSGDFFGAIPFSPLTQPTQPQFGFSTSPSFPPPATPLQQPAQHFSSVYPLSQQVQQPQPVVQQVQPQQPVVQQTYAQPLPQQPTPAVLKKPDDVWDPFS